MKEAHNLAASSEIYHFNVMMGFEHFVKFHLFRTYDDVVLETYNIDDLITKLKELTKPKNKPDMNDNELLEKAAISLQEANACLQLLSE